MKNSIIADIFNGNRGHKESINLPSNILKDLSLIDKKYSELETKLSPELLSLHQEFVEALESHWSKELDFYFAEGFKLGLLIGIECMEP